MRILQLNTWYDKVGGAEIYMHLVIDALRAAGHTVGAFGFSPERSVDEPELRIIQREEYMPANLMHDSEQDRAVTEFVRRFEPDVIHVHNLTAYPADFVLALRALEIPMIQTVHDFSYMCPNSWMVWPDGTVCEGGPGKKCFEHNCQQNYPYDARQITAGRVRLELVSKSFDAYVCPSQFLADVITNHGFEHAEALPLWVDYGDKERPALDALPERRANEVLFVGRLVLEKGVHFLVEAMPHLLKKNPEARLHVVGGGPELENLKALAAKLEVESACTFHGRVPHETVQDFFSRATCQVLPSIWCENSPMTTYESFISGLPMVASRIAGLPAMVREGDTGLLATPRDPVDLADKIATLLGDEELQKRLQNGCREALDRYSKEIHLKRLFEVYDEAIERFASRPRPEPKLADEDLLFALDAQYEEHAKVERWALDMKGHIDYLEESGQAGQPVQKFSKHLIFLAKSRIRQLRGQ